MVRPHRSLALLLAFGALSLTAEARAQYLRAAAPAPDAATTPDAATAPAPAAPRPAGALTIDSQPYATIYLDGRRLGDTPLFRQAVPAGRHRVRAVRADGVARTFTITIAPAKELSYGQIAW